MNASYRIHPYQPQYKQQVVQLVTHTQQIEFGVPITYEQQPDLLDIEGFFRTQYQGELWLALQGETVVGTIGLLTIGQGHGVLRKMFVDPSCRGKGVAQALLQRLEQEAQQRGIRHLYLGTGDMLKAAHRFYEKSGFVTLPVEDLPTDFPRVAVDTVFYCKMLQKAAIAC